MGDIVKNIGGAIFGNKKDAGALGTGQYRAQAYDIDPNAFKIDGLNSYGQEQQSRQGQSSLIQALQDQMVGRGASLADGQLRQATNRNLAQQLAIAASGRGVSPAIAQKMAAQNAASINQQAAADSAIIRQQEMLSAQQQLANALNSQRQGDLAATDRDLSARMGKEQLSVQQQTGLNQTNSSAYGDAAKRRGDFISNIGSGIMALSDERTKAEKGDGAKSIQSFLDSIGAHKYEYKDKFKDKSLAGDGIFVSPMAQELEKTEIGKNMVFDTPDGKVVDYGKGLGAILAAQSALNERLKRIEKKKGA